MATVRQKKLAEAVILNTQSTNPLNKQELVASVGYSLKSADKKATEILESKGTLEALEDYGFSEAKAKEVVGTILKDTSIDANPRLKAAEIVFKVHGSYAPEKSVTLAIEPDDIPAIKELTEQLNALHRGTGITSDGGSSSSVGTETPDKE